MKDLTYKSAREHIFDDLFDNYLNSMQCASFKNVMGTLFSVYGTNLEICETKCRKTSQIHF